MKANNNILEFNNVTIGYSDSLKDVEILNNISGSASGGEMISVIGANGVGKSTLLRSIIGLQEPLEGNIFIDGKSIPEYSQRQLATYYSFVSASAAVSTNLTVHELVSLGRFPHTNWIGKLQSQDREMIDTSISNVGLERFRDRKLNEMSDGEKQRAMIARALAQDTQFIILDEPTAYLDLPNKYELIYLLRDIVESEGKTVIYTTHDLHIAIGESDKIWLLGKSELFEGAPEDLMKEGRFASLFSDSKLEFADESGLYIYPAKIIGEINLKADSKLEKLTRRALLRLKVDSVEKEQVPILEARGDYESATWIIRRPKMEPVSFNSIYDLSYFLRRELFSGQFYGNS